MGQHINNRNVSITFVITIIILLTMKISVFSSIREHCEKVKQKNWIFIIFFIMAIIPGIAPIVASAATPDIYVNQTGWWRADGAFNASDPQIQAAIDNATAGETIYVYNGSYTDNVDVNRQVTLQGEGADVVNVTAALASGHVFNVTVSYVNISGFKVTGATGFNNAGIYLGSGVDHANISDNNASNNYYAIYLNSSSNNSLTNNSANSNNNDGIKLNSLSNNNTLTNNTAILNHDTGISLISSSNNNTLTNNTANSNNIGIGLMTSSNNNTLTNNTANLNIYGIFLNSASNNNTLTNNTANSNSNRGIYLSSASNNTIYNNYFNNTNNAWDDGSNVWNTTITSGTNIIGGSWLGGNYWSDYAGEDTDGDRLGDTLTPYNSSGNIANGGDYLPLMTVDTTAPSITIISPVNTTYIHTSIVLNVTTNQTANVTYSLNGAANLSLYNLTTGGNTTITGTEGENNITVYARDPAGNLNSSIVYFTVETAPVVTASKTYSDYAQINPMTIDPNINVTDGETNVTGARVSIGDGYVSSEDYLNYTTINGITGNYSTTTGILTLTGNRSGSDYQAAFRNVSYWNNNTNNPNRSQRNITFAIGNNSLYYPGTRHYYEYVPASLYWTNSNASANNRTFYGLQGYLATINSSEENTFLKEKVSGDAWIGASDSAVEGDWRWVTGPEAGTLFYIGTGASHTTFGYNNWEQSSEPNDYNNGNPGEDYAYMYSGSGHTPGTWNDKSSTSQMSYFTEYGGMAGDPTLHLTATVIVNVTDITPPMAPTISVPVDGASLTSAYTWVNGTMSADTTNVTIYVNDSITNDSVSISGTTYSISNVPLGSDGIHEINVSAKDAAGNVNSTNATVIVTVDTTAPYITIISPVNTSYNNASILLNITTDQTANVTYSLNGAANLSLYNLTTGGNTTITGTEGENNITVYANDSVGNLNYSTVNFTIDTIAPSITIISPVNITYSNISIVLNVITNQIANVTYSLNGAADISLHNLTTSGNTVITAMEGANNITVYANDSAGNLNSSIVYFIVDTTAPSLSITRVTSPTNVTYQNITGTVSDTGGVGTVTVNGIAATNGTGYYYYNLTGLELGNNTITVIATDLAENAAINTTYILVIPRVPAITSYAPSSSVSDSTGATRTFNININQVVNVTWYLNGTQLFTNTSVTEANYTNSSAGSGTWNVTAIVNNTNGTDSQEWTWIVMTDNMPPVITISVPVNNANISIFDRIISGSITDDSAITANMYVNSLFTNNWVSKGSFRWPYNFTNGSNNINILATDAYKNSNWTNISVFVLSPVNEASLNLTANQSLNITANDSTGVDVVLATGNNTANVTVKINASINASYFNVSDIDTEFVILGIARKSLVKFVEINATGEVVNLSSVKITMFYNDSDLDLNGNGIIDAGDIKEDTLNLYWHWGNDTSGSQEWFPLTLGADYSGKLDRNNHSGPIVSSVEKNTAFKYISVSTNHFSLYSIAGAPIPAIITTTTGSSGSGTGGSGVVTSEPSENIARYEMIERNLEPGKPVTYTFTKNQDVIYEVLVTGKENEYDVSMRIEILKNRSKQAKENAPGLVYRNANIISGTKNIGENVIKFKVNDSWLLENGFDSSDIRLVKWVDNKWITLETGVLFNKDGYTHFSAKSMTFSIYAITGIKKEEMMPSATEKTAVTPEAAPLSTEERTPAPEGKTPLWIWMILALLLIAALVYALKRR